MYIIFTSALKELDNLISFISIILLTILNVLVLSHQVNFSREYYEIIKECYKYTSLLGLFFLIVIPVLSLQKLILGNNPYYKFPVKLLILNLIFTCYFGLFYFLF